MGLMDSLKKATGLGLKASEHYDRAWEKGVLLGPARYLEAASLFDAAQRKAIEAQDPSLAARSLANRRLYEWVSTGDPQTLQQLREALEGLSELEAVGSRTEFLPVPSLQSELDGRLLELQLAALPVEAHQERIQLHAKASESFKRIFSAPLCSYRFHAPDEHVQTAQSRFFLHQGFLGWHAASAIAESDPEAAAEHAAKSLASFRQCNDQKWAQTTEALLSRLRTRRTCWMCHRELQGLDIHVKAYPARVHPYVVAQVAKLGQDVSSLDATANQLILCTPCGSALERQADAFATARVNQLNEQLQPVLTGISQQLDALRGAVHALQNRFTSH